MGILLLIGGCALAVLLVCGGILAALLLPAVQQAREAARRTQCKNNLHQIGLALHNYHDAFNSFPPAYIPDASGRPMHSWRVLILPFLDQAPLYQRYRFDEPWDGPNNSQLLPLMPQVFRCPTHGQPGDTVTAFAGVFGPNSVFRGTNGTSFADITDGASNTLSVAEVTTGARIPWMKPEDVDITIHSMLGDPAGFGSHHVGGFNALMLDGSVRFISTSISPTILQGLYTIDGNEQIQDF